MRSAAADGVDGDIGAAKFEAENIGQNYTEQVADAVKDRFNQFQDGFQEAAQDT